MFHQTKDNITLYNSFEALGLKCILCGQEEHAARNCHRVHYVPDKDKIIKKYQNDLSSFYKGFKRYSIRHQFHARRSIVEVEKRAKEYCDDHPTQIQKIVQGNFGTAFF